jgi:hypothetical protein
MRRVPVQAQAVATNVRWGRSAMISSRPGSCRRRRHPQCVAGLDQRGDGVLRRDEIALAGGDWTWIQFWSLKSPFLSIATTAPSA